MMTELLQAVVTEGTGKAVRLLIVTAAGKTGTTQEYRDAWFIGFTPELVVGVWVGNDDNELMKTVVGGDLPAAIWRDFVSRALPLVSGRGGSCTSCTHRDRQPGSDPKTNGWPAARRGRGGGHRHAPGARAGGALVWHSGRGRAL